MKCLKWKSKEVPYNMGEAYIITFVSHEQVTWLSKVRL